MKIIEIIKTHTNRLAQITDSDSDSNNLLNINMYIFIVQQIYY